MKSFPDAVRAVVFALLAGALIWSLATAADGPAPEQPTPEETTRE